MTDKTQPEAGSTHIIRYALELGLLWIDGDGRNKVREALNALDALEAKLATAKQQAAPKAAPVKACVCGEPQAPGTVHRVDGPCYVAAPQQEPCQTCIAMARTVMMDQVSFARKPDCYGIRQVTDDEGIEEWEDIRTSPDVAREEANDMMATGRGEVYEVVPLWTTPQPAPAPLSDAQIKELIEDGVFLGNCKEIVRAIEHAHGITGGQHGD